MAKGFIQTVCEKYGLTQKQLAEELDIPIRTVENWAYRNNCPMYLRFMIMETLEYRVLHGVMENCLSLDQWEQINQGLAEGKKDYMRITEWERRPL